MECEVCGKDITNSWYLTVAECEGWVCKTFQATEVSTKRKEKITVCDPKTVMRHYTCVCSWECLLMWVKESPLSPYANRDAVISLVDEGKENEEEEGS